MPGITATREVLEQLLGREITSEHFSAVKATVVSLIKAQYSGDVHTATGRHQDVLNSVFIRVAIRMITNPSGARSIGLGAAQVTLGGSDEDIASISLNSEERRELSTLKKRRPTSLPLTPYDNRFLLPNGFTYFNNGTDTGSLAGSENVTIVVQEATE